MTERAITQPQKIATPANTPVHAGLLQRKCACGGSAGLTGQCAECGEERLTLQRRAADQSTPSAVPPIVEEVLLSPGQSLDEATRASMESRFGHSFANVRVHADARAAESARAVNAHAYTVGANVVFASGKYQPGTSAGRQLLAHELTHVVQQSPSSGASGASRLDAGFSETAAEAEADRNAKAISGGQTNGIHFNAHADVQAGTIQRKPAEDEEVEKSLKAAGRAQAEPDEKTKMMIRGSEIVYRLISKFLPAYADKISGVGYDEKLSGIKVVKSKKGDISITVGKDFILNTNEDTLQQRVTEIETQLRDGKAPQPVCKPDRPLTWSDFTGKQGSYDAYTAFHHEIAKEGGEDIIRAVLDSSRSYVRPKFSDPGNRAVNSCADTVKACEKVYATHKDVTVPLAPPKSCAASVSPNLSLKATNKEECDSILGTECDRVATLESARLLRHEQLHFDMACNLARNGTRMLAAKPGDAQKILKAVEDKAKDVSSDSGLYDSETDHGCRAAEQSAWERYVKLGLPTIQMP